MFSRKLALLAAGYVAWNVVSSLYNAKKGKDLKKTIGKAKQAGENDKSVIINNIIDTHKNFFDDIKWMLSEENQKLLETKKLDVLKIVDSFKSEWDKLVKGVGWKTTWMTNKLQKLYDGKRDEIRSHLQEVSPDEMKAVTDKLFTYFDGFMWKLKKTPAKKASSTKKQIVKKKVTTKKKPAIKKTASAKVEIKKSPVKKPKV